MEERQREKREAGPAAESSGGADLVSAERLEAILAKLTEEKNGYVRKQFYMSAVTMICSLLIFGVILAAYLTVIPKVDSAFRDVETVMNDVEKISGQLAEVDIKGLAEDIDQMTVTSQQGISEALEKINAINIDELNQAIKGLSDVVTPFAKLMNHFK